MWAPWPSATTSFPCYLTFSFKAAQGGATVVMRTAMNAIGSSHDCSRLLGPLSVHPAVIGYQV